MIIGKGLRGPNPPGLSINTFGAQFAEVEVDTETGQVRVLRVVAAHESGRILNPLTASNQVEGGVTQAVGFALYEERVLNSATGRMVNANLHDYRLPTSEEIPEIEAVFVPMSDPIANNIGCKGLGEPPIIPTAGAIANAVYDAIGVRITELPMTPSRVLARLSATADLRPARAGRAARRGRKGAAHA
jgi:xanthine dehydrogenase YagR molybdenum-binding subunit